MKTKIMVSLNCGALSLLALLPLASMAAETTEGAHQKLPSVPQTYVLFTGTDIRVLRDGLLHRVCGVDGGSFIIKVKDKNVEIPMGKDPEVLKVKQVQMLTDHCAIVTNYKYDRVYTPANDPYRKFEQGMKGVATLSESADRMESVARETPLKMDTYDPRKNPIGPTTVTNPKYATNNANAQMARSGASGSMDASFYTRRLSEELAQKLFDALEVQFEASSVKPIEHPYVVIQAKYHEKDDPKHVQHWVFAKALDSIDATPRKVFVSEAGFPPGFIVEKLQVHLYDKEHEIATDLSENRTPLTRDEAHEYLVIEHVSTHKTDTLPAKVALTKLPEDWATHSRDASLRKTYYVKTDKAGHPGAAFEDEDGTKPVADAYCAGILRSLLFLPALKNGEAVDGVAEVKLTELSM